MTPSELERYLHDHIPLSRAMAVQVVSIADDRVPVAAPLAPNQRRGHVSWLDRVKHLLNR